MKPSRAPRIANAVLGLWLFVSVLIWPHTSSQTINMCAIGALAFIVALLGTKYSTIRYVNSILAVWLLISAWAGQVATEVTSWNATFVAFAMFALSLVPLAPTKTA
jgi:hypothetical protein